MPPLIKHLIAQIVLLGLRGKSSPAPPGTTRVKPAVPAGTCTCARGPPSFSNAMLVYRCSTPAPSCPPRFCDSGDRLCVLVVAVMCSAARLFYFLAELVVAALPSSAVSGIRAHSSVCCAAAAFLAQGWPKSVAQTAHCVRIILYMVKSLGGSPTMRKNAQALRAAC